MIFRSITYDGKNSFKDLGLIILPYPDTAVGHPPPRHNFETLPYRNGNLDTAGGVFYDNRELTYCFHIAGISRAEVEQKAARAEEWLSGKTLDLYDSDFAGSRFTDVTRVNSCELVFNSRNGTSAKFKVTFSAAPYMLSSTGTTTTLITLYEKTFTLYLLDKSVCFDETHAKGLVNQPVKKITDTRYRLELGENLTDGLCAFSRLDGSVFHNNTVVSVEGAAMEKQGNFYYGYGIASGGKLTFTVTVEKPPTDYSWVGCFVGTATAYTADTLNDYGFEAYTAAHPSFTVNGAAADMKRFTIADRFVNEIAVVGSVQGMYTLKFDSVERRL